MPRGVRPLGIPRRSHGDHLGGEGVCARPDRRSRALVTVDARPGFCLAHERAELAEQRGRRATRTLELLDPLEAAQHGARFVHVLTVAARKRPNVSTLCLRRLGRVKPSRPGPQAQQRLVQRPDERGAIAVRKGLDEAPPDRLLGAAARTLAPNEPTQRLQQRGAVATRLPEQHRRAHRGGPEAVGPAEQRRERLPQLLGAERLGLEQRQLPAIERLAELRILVGGDQARAEVGREPAAEGVEARRLAARLGGRDRQDGTDPVRAPVQPLEEDGAGRDRAGSASRSAVTASESSPGASGASEEPGASARSSSRTQSRSVSRPKSCGRRPVASGQRRASSPAAATRTRMPSPSSICVPTEIPTSGATAAYECPSPKSERSSLA